MSALDIGNTSYHVRSGAKDLIDVWMEQPSQRCQFGDREIADIAEAVLGLSTLLREIMKLKKDAA